MSDGDDDSTERYDDSADEDATEFGAADDGDHDVGIEDPFDGPSLAEGGAELGVPDGVLDDVLDQALEDTADDDAVDTDELLVGHGSHGLVDDSDVADEPGDVEADQFEESDPFLDDVDGPALDDDGAVWLVDPPERPGDLFVVPDADPAGWPFIGGTEPGLATLWAAELPWLVGIEGVDGYVAAEHLGSEIG